MVVAAVERVLDCAADSDRSIDAVARAWVGARGGSLIIEDAVLPAGVFGRWLSMPGSDIVQVGVGVVSRDRTIAHELGHMVLGHRGLPVTEYVEGLAQAASPELIAHMLQRACCHEPTDESGATQRDELAAEWFAGVLTRRVRGWQRRGRQRSHNIDDAIG